MKTREQIVRFIEGKLSGEVADPCPQAYRHHYGKCELQQLMDFIFDGPPLVEAEKFKQDPWP